MHTKNDEPRITILLSRFEIDFTIKYTFAYTTNKKKYNEYKLLKKTWPTQKK